MFICIAAQVPSIAHLFTVVVRRRVRFPAVVPAAAIRQGIGRASQNVAFLGCPKPPRGYAVPLNLSYAHVLETTTSR